MDLLSEIKEDLRAERTGRLWQRYGKWIIYSAVSIVIITAVMSYNKYQHHQQSMAFAEAWMEVNQFIVAEDYARALKQLEAISPPTHPDTQDMLTLQKIRILHALNEPENIAPLVASLAKRNSIYSDVVKLWVQDAEAIAALKPTMLAVSLAEHQAWTYFLHGDDDAALAGFKDLLKQDNLPSTLRERVVGMVLYIEAGK